MADTTQHRPFVGIGLLALFLVIAIRFIPSGIAGHMDEYDYLFVGKTLLDGQDWPTHTYIFGWDLNWYAYGLADRYLNGLSGARLVASLLGFVSIAGMYCFCQALWNRHQLSAIAAVLLGLDAAHMHISGLATYDIISLCFFIWAMFFTVKACKENTGNPIYTVCAALFLLFAVLSKYTTAVYLPLIGILALLLAPRQTIAAMLVITTGLIAYAAQHFDQLRILYDIQISGTHQPNAESGDVIQRTVRQQLILLGFVAAGITYLALKRIRAVVAALTLLALSSPMFLYHYHSQNVISLQKHLVYCSVFMIPIAAFFIHTWLIGSSSTKKASTIVMTMLALYSVYNVYNLHTMNSSFPDVTPIVEVTEDNMHKYTVLSEDPYLFRYLFKDVGDQGNYKETSWIDNNMDGIHEHRDVKQAIWGRKFDLVYLNDQIHPVLNIELRTMLEQRGYQVLAERRYVLNTMSGRKRTGKLGLYVAPAAKISLADTNQSLQ